MCSRWVSAIYQIYIVGPLTGAVSASAICYIMWCGSSSGGRPYLPLFNSLSGGGGGQSRKSRCRLRVSARVVQFVGFPQPRPVDEVDWSSTGGPPVCHVSTGRTAVSSADSNDKSLFTTFWIWLPKPVWFLYVWSSELQTRVTKLGPCTRDPHDDEGPCMRPRGVPQWLRICTFFKSKLKIQNSQ